MKKLALHALLMIVPTMVNAVPKTGGPLYVAYGVVVVDQCDGMDRVATYKFRNLARARLFRNMIRNRTGVKATWIKRVK